MSANLEIPLYPFYYAVQVLCLQHPLLKHSSPQSFRTGARQNDDASLTYCLLRIGQGLLCLIQVQILWSPSLGYNHDICQLIDLHTVKPVQEPASLSVGLLKLTCHSVNHIFMLVQNHVQKEIHAADTCRLFQVLPHRIPFKGSRLCHGVNHPAVVFPNGLHGGNARHDCLCSARITGKKMVFNIAQTYSQVSMRHLIRYVHRCAGLCLSHMNKAAFGRVHASASIIYFVPRQMPHLL